jgi:predicted nuclease of predicted toxin-antitoxin system
MRFLADENFPGSIVESLRGEGHDVFWVRVESPGAKDEIVLSRAQEEDRILLTFDKDFGELAFRSDLATAPGIVLFRMATSSPKRLHDRTLTALHQKIKWVGHFAVVEDDRIRLTPLPKYGKGPRRFEKDYPGVQETPAVYRVRPEGRRRAGKPKRKNKKKKSG